MFFKVSFQILIIKVVSVLSIVCFISIIRIILHTKEHSIEDADTQNHIHKTFLSKY